MNLKKILIILAVIAVVIVVAVYVMGMFEQTKPIADTATGLGNQAVDYAQSNIPVVTAYAGTVSAAIGGVALIKKQATDKVTAVTTDAESQITTLKDTFSQEKDALNTQITDAQETAKTQITQATDLQKAAETKAAELETANTQLQGKVDGAMEMHNNFVAQLTSGAQTVIDPATNQTYKLITLEKTVIK